jgi:hypothetical protein
MLTEIITQGGLETLVPFDAVESGTDAFYSIGIVGCDTAAVCPFYTSRTFRMTEHIDTNADHAAAAVHGAGAQDATDAQASPELLQRLESGRQDLLKVHRALLAVERIRYEKARGRIENNSAFLQLVINDPWFDWLRPMAQLVLLIDERTSDKKAPLGENEGKSLLARTAMLLKADVNGDAFQRLFYQAVQMSPDLAVLARQVATASGQRQ